MDFIQLRAAAVAAVAAGLTQAMSGLTEHLAARGHDALIGVSEFVPAKVSDQAVVLSEVEGWGFQGVLVTLQPSSPVFRIAGKKMARCFCKQSKHASINLSLLQAPV